MNRTFVDPRIFDQLKELPPSERKIELKALVKLSKHGYIDTDIGDRAARELKLMLATEGW